MEDTLTRRQESLQTRHRQEAVRDPHGPGIGHRPPPRQPRPREGLSGCARAANGPAHLAGRDGHFVARGQPTTRERQQRAMRSRPFRLLAEKKLVETTADDFRQVIALGGASTNLFLRCRHNLALCRSPRWAASNCDCRSEFEAGLGSGAAGPRTPIWVRRPRQTKSRPEVMPSSSPTTSADLPLASQFWTASSLNAGSYLRRTLEGGFLKASTCFRGPILSPPSRHNFTL